MKPVAAVALHEAVLLCLVATQDMPAPEALLVLLKITFI
jgi:hypothetical protein